MSLGNCHAEDGEKIGRLDERLESVKRVNEMASNTVTGKMIACLAFGIAAAAAFIAWTAIRDIAAMQERLYRVETEQKELYKKCEEAERDYNSARSSISQLRSKRSKN